MFDSIYTTEVTAGTFFIMALAAVVSGLLFAWIMSFRMRSKPRFFIVIGFMPFIVASIITFVNGNIGAGIAVGGAFGLTRFRSAQGSADEIAAILIAMTSGIIFGMGYLAYGIIVLIVLAALYFLISGSGIFVHKNAAEERLLRITIPESLEYNGVFDDTFDHYLRSYSQEGVKTTGMGSMFRLSYKIVMKNRDEEKAFIDELRTKNGNLEIAVLPYTEPENRL
ncbi:MAG: DUF4956 domain-containing protein [Clostridia bacterium]|nr:DUF4956 domain-containing protein [Clostridia bacterium]